MKTINICALIMVVTVVAFIGFCVENIWLAFSKGFMDNRNMFLPFLLGYGIAMLIVYLLFGLPHQPLFFGVKNGKGTVRWRIERKRRKENERY